MCLFLILQKTTFKKLRKYNFDRKICITKGIKEHLKQKINQLRY